MRLLPLQLHQQIAELRGFWAVKIVKVG